MDQFCYPLKDCDIACSSYYREILIWNFLIYGESQILIITFIEMTLIHLNLESAFLYSKYKSNQAALNCATFGIVMKFVKHVHLL